jgi:hypothetical protein
MVSMFKNYDRKFFVYFPGSIIASFLTSSNTTANGQAFNQVSSTLNVAGYSVSGISFMGRVTSFQSTSPTTNSPGSSISTVNIGMIIGATIGSILGASILVLGAFFGYRAYKNKQKPFRLIGDPDDENSLEPQSFQKDEGSLKLESTGSALIPPLQEPSPIENESNVIRDVSFNIPTVSSPVNRLRSPPISNTPRAPSAAISVTMLNVVMGGNGQCNNSKMPDVELIKFD